MNAWMDHLAASPLVHRLCWTLVHSLWQGLVVALLLAIMFRAMRNSSAASRHTVACVALLAFGLCPVVTFVHLGKRALPVMDASPPSQTNATGMPLLPPVFPETRDASDTPPTSKQAVASQPKPVHGMHWEALVVATWLCGMLILSLRHAAGWMFLQRLRRDGTSPLAQEWGNLVAHLCRIMGLQRPITVRWSTRVQGPVAFGWWRPIILLPLSLAAGIGRDQMEMILAHELAHLRRHDYLINLLQSAVEMILFYHPATWWIASQIRREREHACDDAAVRVVRDKGAYARALVALAELSNASAPAFAQGAAGSRGGLYARVERLLRPAPEAPSLRALPGIGAMLALVLVVTLPSANQQMHAQTAMPTNAEPLRGDIRDRNGVILATTDNPDRQIVFDLDELAKAWRAKHGNEELPTYVQRHPAPEENAYAFKVTETTSVNASAMLDDLVTAQLTAHGLAEPYNAKSFNGSSTWKRVGNSWKPTPTGAMAVYRRFMTEEEFRKAQSLQGQIPGMKTRAQKYRRYPFGALAAHLLGYVHENRGRQHLPPEEGLSGVEHTWDQTLTPRRIEDRTALRGDDVYLTLDARHQMIVEQTLRQAGVGRGAAVLLDVNSGDVLAMASVPSFDPADFLPSIPKEKYEQYSHDPGYPFLNRVCTAEYAPGAAFLPVTCLAAVMSGHEDAEYDCSGSVHIGGRTFHCWIAALGPTGHGHLNMAGALEASCNVYFYQLAIAVGMKQLSSTASLLGLGKKTGLGLPEEMSGIWPDVRSIEKKDGRKWGDASTANTAIGQGYLLTTPLQMADVISTCANGGTVWRPRLVDRIVSSSEGSTMVPPKVRSADLREHGLTESGLEIIRRGLLATVNGEHGTGKSAGGGTLQIAGRTGTSQSWNPDGSKDNKAWFLCYAPAEQPRWALAVVVENGKSGGGVAAPIAKHILEQVAAVEAGTLKIELKPLSPAQGHMHPIEEVKF